MTWQLELRHPMPLSNQTQILSILLQLSTAHETNDFHPRKNLQNIIATFQTGKSGDR